MIENINYNGYDFDQSTTTMQNLTGVGFPTIRTSNSERALQDGSIGTSHGYGARPFGWKGHISKSTMADYLAERQSISYSLGNVDETGETMTFTLATGDTRTLRNVVPVGNPIFDFVENEPSLLWNSYVLQFRADFPFFEGAESTNNQGITEIVGGAAIPSPVAMPLSASATGSTYPATLTNNGSAPAYPTMTIEGPGTDFTVTNSTTGHSFTLSITLSAGEAVDLDMWHRTAERDTGSNVLGSFSGDYIYLEGGASGQDNTITFSAASGTTSATSLAITWKDTYYIL